MVENKTIGYSVLFSIIGALIMLGGVKLTDSNAYYCENTKIVMNCDSLSKYYNLTNGKCNNNEIGNKLCKTGWLKIEQEIIISPEIINIYEVNKNSEKYSCNPINCTVIT